MKILLLRFRQREGAKNSIPWHYSFYKDILEKQGHLVDIIDNQVEDYSIEENVTMVLKKGYQLVGAGGIGTVYKEVQQFSELLKSKKRDVTIVIGGQVAADYEFVMNSCPIDIVVLGEGEVTLLKIVTCLTQNGNLEEIPGIVLKRDGKFIVTRKEQLVSMDDLPGYNLKNIKIEKYNTDAHDIYLVDNKAKLLKKQGYKFLAIFLARGCPYSCFFCYRHIKGYRRYSKEKLEHILKDLKENGYSFFSFSDECITANRKYLKDICELTKKYEIYWMTSGRVDHIDHEILVMLKESHCIELQYGVESFDDTMLEVMNKKVTRQQNIDVMNLTYQHGFRNVLQLVLGSPGEDRNTLLNTRKGMWSCYFSADKIACAILNPYPGSPAYYYGIENGYIKDKECVHKQFAGKGEIIVNFSKLSTLELKAWQHWLHCEALISYRVKHMTLKIDNYFLFKFAHFAKIYLLLLIIEPVNFVLFNVYLFKGFSYWIKPVKRLKLGELVGISSEKKI